MSGTILRFAINLLWVRPGKVGGTEVMIRNLLDGFEHLPDAFHAFLITSKDNSDSFRHYEKEDSRYQIVVADTESANIGKRIIWQNLHLNRCLKRLNIENCFSPVYDRPVFNDGIRYVSVMHDIQAYHYPRYHPAYEVWYSKLIWKAVRDRSAGIVCISDYVRKDIVDVYRFPEQKLMTIYNPVTVDPKDVCDFDTLKNRYHIQEKGYYYTVGQLIPHKNIGTLLRVMSKLKQQHTPEILLISGISGNAKEDLMKQIRNLKIEDSVRFTGYVTNAERNALYKNAKAFLFPSIFEGFGIPPIEAMIFGTTVITTRCACIPEVTQNTANYVDDPFDPDVWIATMRSAENHSDEIDITRYSLPFIARKYLDYLRSVFSLSPVR